MGSCVGTSERGILIKLVAVCCGKGDGDLNYGNDSDTRKSVAGCAVLMYGAPRAMKSAGTRTVALSVTEAEMYDADNGAQEIMYVTRVSEYIGLQVKKPIAVELDHMIVRNEAH